MPRRKNSNAFRIKGLYFIKNAESPQLRAMVYSLIARYSAQGNRSSDDAALEFFEDMTKLFTTMLVKSELYLAVRGSPVFWSTVMSKLNLEKPMPVQEVTNIVHCYVKAREAYAPPQGDKVTNDMTNLVDQWIEIEAECQSLPTPEAFQVTFTTQPTHGKFEFHNIPFRPKAWPPSHFSVAEKGMITDPRILPLVDGRCMESPGQPMDLPSRTSMPDKTRAFVTGLALMKYHPGRPWRLALGSMGNFLRDGTKVRWARATRYETNLMWTPSGFSIFANSFGAAPEQITAWTETLNKTGISTTAKDMWAARCPRVGMILALRRVSGGIELVHFDPIARVPALQDAYYHANKMAIMQFKTDLFEQLRKATKIPIRGVWTGGNRRRVEDGWDSVQVCCDWLRDFVSETCSQDPFPTTEEGWHEAGFSWSSG